MLIAINVLVPVAITNVQVGPVKCIIFNIEYNTSVLELVGVQNGYLTSLWDDPNYNTFPWGARVAHVYNITG